MGKREIENIRKRRKIKIKKNRKKRLTKKKKWKKKRKLRKEKHKEKYPESEGRNKKNFIKYYLNTYILGGLRSMMVSKIDKQIITGEFNSHRVPHTIHGHVPQLRKA